MHPWSNRREIILHYLIITLGHLVRLFIASFIFRRQLSVLAFSHTKIAVHTFRVNHRLFIPFRESLQPREREREIKKNEQVNNIVVSQLTLKLNINELIAPLPVINKRTRQVFFLLLCSLDVQVVWILRCRWTEFSLSLNSSAQCGSKSWQTQEMA
jgi:hypothetical protein